MKKIALALLSVALFASCSKEQSNMTVNGTIKGLKKGTLYFQKVEDTTLVTLDSLIIDGEPVFEFSTQVESPELFYLQLDKNDGIEENDLLEFFGEPGNISITTTHDYFAPEAKISGSETNDKFVTYKNMISKFRDKNLNLIKLRLEAGKEGDNAKIDSLGKVSDENYKRSYLYTLNYIFNNTNSCVAPYLALTETPNMTVKYLDSLNGLFTPEVANSKYGKAMAEYTERVKAAADKPEEVSQN